LVEPVAERGLIGVFTLIFQEDLPGLAIGRLPWSVLSCPGSGLCGKGVIATPVHCPGELVYHFI